MTSIPTGDGPPAVPDTRLPTLVRVLAWIGLVQAIVAAVVLIHSRIVRMRIRARRPPHYPVRRLRPVELQEAGDRLELFMDGDQLMDDLVESIDAANERVYVETFIWVDDAAGARLRDALVRACERGVEVFVMYDWTLSSKGLDRGFFPHVLPVHVFRPWGLHPAGLSPRNLLRDHRKIVTIDGRVGYTGGYNFGDQYLAWRDTHVRIEGRSVANMETAFVDFWNANREAHLPALERVAEPTFDDDVLIHRNDPSKAVFPIRGMYLEAIERATERIWITNAYFVPDRAFRATLCAAAQRGVDVRIVLPRRSNHPLTDVLAHGMFEELLEAGVRVFLYRDFMVHAKTATIDRHWSTVGTANLDRWSMLGNYEINVEVISDEFAVQMETMFLLDLESCEEVELSAWRRRPFPMKASERTLRAFAPLM